MIGQRGNGPAAAADTETRVAAIVAGVLGLPSVSARDDFFVLGGHAQQAMQLWHELRTSLGADLEFSQVLENPTVADLASLVAGGGYEPIGPVARAETLACTVQQEGLWFEHQLNPRSAAYHIAFELRLTGPLDVTALEQALHELVVRHEALRTRFTDHGGLPRQVIDPPPVSFPLPVTAISPGQVQAWTAAQVDQPMNLAHGPLVRFALARTGPGQHVLVFVLHHIIADGWSVRLLAGELSQLYSAAVTGAPADLAPLAIQPADHAAWQRRWLTGTELGRQLSYWREILADLPTIDFPADRPRPAQPTGAGSIALRPLPAQVGMAARDYARTRQVSFLAVLHAALLVVVNRWTSQTDLPIGSVFSGRTRAETEPLIGYFANTLVLRTGLDSDLAFADLVLRCNDTVMDAAAHQEVPFGLVVDALQPERVAGRNPLFQISLTSHPAETGVSGLALGQLGTVPSVLATRYCPWDISIEVGELSSGQFQIRTEYSTELFDDDRIERLLNHFTAALAGGLAAPGQPAIGIELMSPAEQEHALQAGNPPRTDRVPGLLHQVTAGHNPDSTAIRYCDRHHTENVTYAQLESRANQLARALQHNGTTPGDVIALLLDRGPQLTIAQLAVLKTGAIWMPLDPQNPPTRLASQINDASATLVLTTSNLASLAELAAPQTARWSLDDPGCRARIDRHPAESPEADVRPDDAAYLIYTSGSTGTPKGILTSHRSAYAYCENAVRMAASSPADRVAQVANTTFDATVFDTFATLLAGATMISTPREVIADPDGLTTLLDQEQVTVAYIPPGLLTALDPERLAGSALRDVFAGGEELPPETVHRFLTACPGLRLHNPYGPTETTVECTDHVCQDTATYAPVPIGTALPGQRAYVLDSSLRPAPIGVPGQLFIAGLCLAHGYLNQPTLTAEKFIADPYTNQPGQRMYATGDQARRRPDGTLDYLGRTDRQVKLRGQRAELGEIEHALTQHPAIRQAAVQVRDQAGLVAYVVAEPGAVEPDALREFLADRLPTYMIPVSYLTLPELPLTPNGKLDPSQLPDPNPRATDYVPPRTSTERWLAAAWTEVLGIGQPVGVTDNFFDIGGNSLHMTQLINRISDQFGRQLDPRQFFTNPVLEQLAGQLAPAAPATVPTAGSALDDEIAELERLLAEKRAAKSRRADQRRIGPVPRAAAMACTVQQEGLWFEQQMNPQNATFNIAFALQLTGPLHIPALQDALHALIVRHEALRTSFTDHGGRPHQVIDPPPPDFPLPVTDIASDQVQAWAAAQVDQPMDLAHGPLFRIAVARTAPERYVLVLMLHHIIGDGWSVRLLAGELSQLYTATVTGTPPALAPLPIQPADHAAWQRQRLSGGELERQLDYWRENLAGLPTIDFPADRPRPAVPTGAGACTQRRLPDELAITARDWARTRQVSFLAVLHAALLVVLNRWTSQTDLPIGSVFSGRTRAETEPLIGYFINQLVLRTTVDGQPSFSELVRRCHDTVMDVTAHQEVPMSLVVDALQPERVAGRNPLFQICLSLLPPGASLGGLDLNGVTAEPQQLYMPTSRIDLSLNMTHGQDGTLGAEVEYSTELFDGDRIDRLLDHFTAALAGGLAAPDQPATGIELMSAAERGQLLEGFNQTGADYPPQFLHQLIEGWARSTPDAVAVIDHDGTEYRYGALEVSANQLAHRLIGLGAGPGAVVGVCLHRSMELVTALVATWKAGAAFLPLDPDLPPDRLGQLITDARPAAIVTATSAGGALVDYALTAIDGAGIPAMIEVDAERDTLAREPAGVPSRPGGQPVLDGAAYVLYTSGSTGTPKGVINSHRGITNRITWMQHTYPLTPADRVLQKTPISFDVSIWEFFWPLTTGATLVLAAPGGHRDPHYLHHLITTTNITTCHFVPTMLTTYLDTTPQPAPPTPLRHVFASGEALPAATTTRFHDTWPTTALHNLYGPTEAAIDVTAWTTTPTDNPVPIGHPIANHRAYLLDPTLRPVPIGVPGQLYITGPGLAHGYLSQPALTAQKFIADPYHPHPGQRMYATGDLARRRPDGTIDYLGRTDRQIKLRGQRIEPAEIEHALTHHPHIRHAAVVAHRDTLTAYLVPDPGLAELDLPALRRYLADQLPTYMIPASYQTLAELPLTTSGKLDAARLPEPAPETSSYEAPRTGTERWLAAAWTEVLGTGQPVGVTDNFFDIGGNSLHMTQLINRISDEFGLQLHLRQLFASPVLEQLAALIDEGGAGSGSGPATVTPDAGLVAFRSSGSRVPLFLIHPMGGSVTCYAQLAQALGEDQPVYGIEDPGLRGEPATDDLARRARQYTELIRARQPHGPYLVGGWSYGGWIAQEMGCQLAAAGEDVSVFALDTGAHPESRTPTDIEIGAGFVTDVAGIAGAPLPGTDLARLETLDRTSLENLALDTLITAGVATPDMRADLRTRMLAFEANYRAILSHRPQPFGGPAVLITAAGNAVTQDGTGWAALAPALDHRTTGGDHYSMLRAPHLAGLAATLRDALAGAGGPRFT